MWVSGDCCKHGHAGRGDGQVWSLGYKKKVVDGRKQAKAVFQKRLRHGVTYKSRGRKTFCKGNQDRETGRRVLCVSSGRKAGTLWNGREVCGSDPGFVRGLQDSGCVCWRCDRGVEVGWNQGSALTSFLLLWWWSGWQMQLERNLHEALYLQIADICRLWSIMRAWRSSREGGDLSWNAEEERKREKVFEWAGLSWKSEVTKIRDQESWRL